MADGTLRPFSDLRGWSGELRTWPLADCQVWKHWLDEAGISRRVALTLLSR